MDVEGRLAVEAANDMRVGAAEAEVAAVSAVAAVAAVAAPTATL